MPGTIEKTGVVKSTTPYGFRMEGEPDKFDYSKQAGDLVHANTGERVKVKVSRSKDDDKWWVNGIQLLNGSTPSTNGNGYHAPAGDDRQQSIVRQSSLKAAVEFYGMVTHEAEECGRASDHVLILAAKFEEWVTR